MGMRTLDLLGSDTVMWASDYPHPDSTWPESQEVVDQALPRLARRGQAEDRLAERGDALQPVALFRLEVQLGNHHELSGPERRGPVSFPFILVPVALIL